MKKALAAVAMVSAVLLAMLLGAVVSGGWPKAPIGTQTSSSNTSVLRSIERQEKVVLLSLGMQGIAEEGITSTIFGHEVPGTGRTLYLQYNYRALLGVDGGRVTIRQTGPNAYVVAIPTFEFIGHDDVTFKTAVEKNGVISWVTPQIDTAAVITRVLNDDAKRRHLVDHADLLRQQADAFYRGIIRGVDPAATVTFEFAPLP